MKKALALLIFVSFVLETGVSAPALRLDTLSPHSFVQHPKPQDPDLFAASVTQLSWLQHEMMHGERQRLQTLRRKLNLHEQNEPVAMLDEERRGKERKKQARDEMLNPEDYHALSRDALRAGDILAGARHYLDYLDARRNSDRVETLEFNMSPSQINQFLEEYFKNPNAYPEMTYRQLELLFVEMIGKLKKLDKTGQWKKESSLKQDPLAKNNIFKTIFKTYLGKWEKVPVLVSDRRNMWTGSNIKKFCTVLLIHFRGVDGINGFSLKDQENFLKSRHGDVYSVGLPEPVWFIGCFLGDTNLRGVDLHDAMGSIFFRADLEGANLKCVLVSGYGFEEANLRGADLQFATAERGANFSGADLRRANLSHSKLRECRFEDANLSQANLQQADLTLANLENADLCGAVLREAKFTRANLEKAKILSKQVAQMAKLTTKKKLRTMIVVDQNPTTSLRENPSCDSSL